MTNCIKWDGPVDRWGYGRTTRWGPNRERAVHRIAWAKAHGPIPDGMNVLHHCDNPPCHNVEHLFLGTDADNVSDMIAKGRDWRGEQAGEKNPMVKLTEGKVRAIREDARTQAEIAVDLGVSRPLISMIKARKLWVHVV